MTVKTDPHIVLRYFAVIARAQPLRDALADAGVAHEDVRITLAEWPKHRDDAAFAGPYRALPTLTWDGETISETLPIASFLARRLGHYEGLDHVAIAHQEAVCSNAYIEAIVRTGELLWADVLYPGANLSATFPRLVGRMIAKLEGLDAQTTERFFGGERPVMADFFAAEGFEALRYLLGPSRQETIFARLPRLTALARRVRLRPAIARMHRPDRFTARPDEDTVLERFHSLPAPL